jgi:hypothetical protein
MGIYVQIGFILVCQMIKAFQKDQVLQHITVVSCMEGVAVTQHRGDESIS